MERSRRFATSCKAVTDHSQPGRTETMTSADIKKTRPAAVPDKLRLGLTSFLDIFGDAIRNYRINGDTK